MESGKWGVESGELRVGRKSGKQTEEKSEHCSLIYNYKVLPGRTIHAANGQNS